MTSGTGGSAKENINLIKNHMNQEDVIQYCLGKPEAMETYPANDDASVYKVRHKMFALVSDNQGIGRINVKCDPDKAVVLREKYESIIPGYRMNKRHWNTILLNGSVPADKIRQLIDHSYGLVVNGLMDADRKAMEDQYDDELLYRQLPLTD